MSLVFGELANLSGKTYDVDPLAIRLYPSDRPKDLRPVKVTGDGDCLFQAASLFATGSEDSGCGELRCLTARELAENAPFYAHVCFTSRCMCKERGFFFLLSHLFSQVLDSSSDVILTNRSVVVLLVCKHLAMLLKTLPRGAAVQVRKLAFQRSAHSAV